MLDYLTAAAFLTMIATITMLILAIAKNDSRHLNRYGFFSIAAFFLLVILNVANIATKTEGDQKLASSKNVTVETHGEAFHQSIPQ